MSQYMTEQQREPLQHVDQAASEQAARITCAVDRNLCRRLASSARDHYDQLLRHQTASIAATSLAAPNAATTANPAAKSLAATVDAQLANIPDSLATRVTVASAPRAPPHAPLAEALRNCRQPQRDLQPDQGAAPLPKPPPWPWEMKICRRLVILLLARPRALPTPGPTAGSAHSSRATSSWHLPVHLESLTPQPPHKPRQLLDSPHIVQSSILHLLSEMSRFLEFPKIFASPIVEDHDEPAGARCGVAELPAPAGEGPEQEQQPAAAEHTGTGASTTGPLQELFQQQRQQRQQEGASEGEPEAGATQQQMDEAQRRPRDRWRHAVGSAESFAGMIVSAIVGTSCWPDSPCGGLAHRGAYGGCGCTLWAEGRRASLALACCGVALRRRELPAGPIYEARLTDLTHRAEGYPPATGAVNVPPAPSSRSAQPSAFHQPPVHPAGAACLDAPASAAAALRSLRGPSERPARSGERYPSPRVEADCARRALAGMVSAHLRGESSIGRLVSVGWKAGALAQHSDGISSRFAWP
ncbi:unnamed protein product [Prorocentrum cordatum]|uniref:Uncharacterized protein n=1 Tax=Prorocentrum cordatum TaxID=2364126 RepID=A0ABN9RSI4_9DINO|nr:unnamed protein product [Polarella glacialis]